MDYKEYEEKASTTACYNKKVALPYVVLGLCSELGEAYEKLNNNDELEEVGKEIGDNLWYLAMIRRECNLTINNWDWKEFYSEDKDITPFDLPTQAGKIADQVKKWLRDDWDKAENGDLPENRKTEIEKAWKEVWKLLNSLVYRMGMDIEDIAKQNIDKLFSRKQRDKIHGAGDNR